MKVWPVPNCKTRELPSNGQPGSFWEDRKDRHHAGIDIYAPYKNDVLSIEDGVVIEVKVFTSPDWVKYWNITYSVVIGGSKGMFLRYAEMDDATVKEGDKVKAGQLIGHIGLVLNPEKIDETSPKYIQNLIKAGFPSMLHFELHNSPPPPLKQKIYMGGNYFINEKPADLEDPTPFLSNIPVK